MPERPRRRKTKQASMDVKVNKVSHFLKMPVPNFVWSLACQGYTVPKMWRGLCIYGISFIVYTQRIYSTIHCYLGCDRHNNVISNQLQIFQKNIFRHVQDRKEENYFIAQFRLRKEQTGTDLSITLFREILFCKLITSVFLLNIRFLKQNYITQS